MNDSVDVLTGVREVLGKYTEAARLHTAPAEEVSLYALSISSIDMIAIVVELEDRFGCSIDDAHTYGMQTLADLVRVIDAQRAIVASERGRA